MMLDYCVGNEYVESSTFDYLVGAKSEDKDYCTQFCM